MMGVRRNDTPAALAHAVRTYGPGLLSLAHAELLAEGWTPEAALDEKALTHRAVRLFLREMMAQGVVAHEAAYLATREKRRAQQKRRATAAPPRKATAAPAPRPAPVAAAVPVGSNVIPFRPRPAAPAPGGPASGGRAGRWRSGDEDTGAGPGSA